MNDFHETRRRFIGSSDAPVLWGKGYASQSVYSLWRSKVFGDRWQPTAEEQRRLDVGNAMEPIIRDWASAELGVMIEKPTVPFDSRYMGAHLDGCHYDEHREFVVDEFKHIGGWQQRQQWFDSEGDAVPDGYWIQVQHQLHVSGAEYGLLWGMYGDELLVRKIDRDEEFLRRHVEQCKAFWGYVERREPPPVDGSQATTDAIVRAFPRPAKVEPVTLPADADEWTSSIKALDEQIKRLESTRDELKNKLRAAIGDHEAGRTLSGQLWTWKLQQRKSYTVAASESRVLKLVKGKS